MSKTLVAYFSASGVTEKIAEKLSLLNGKDNETLKKYAKLLYGEACLIGGKAIDDPAEHSKLICELMLK